MTDVETCLVAPTNQAEIVSESLSSLVPVLAMTSRPSWPAVVPVPLVTTDSRAVWAFWATFSSIAWVLDVSPV